MKLPWVVQVALAPLAATCVVIIIVVDLLAKRRVDRAVRAYFAESNPVPNAPKSSEDWTFPEQRGAAR